MHFAFQTRSHLYLVMDYLSGGDMRYHLCNRIKFKEKETQFIVACIVSALEYIHGQGYLHRDIKPENLVFDSEGYLHVTDFGISKKHRSNNKKDSSGTPGYMAPEVMCRQNHNQAVDFFAVGVIAYECMFLHRPFGGKNRQEIRDSILESEVKIRNSRIPYGWSYEAADFINQCIKRKKFERLGYHGIAEVKNHPWLQEFDWKGLYKKTLTPPFKPPKSDNFDLKAEFQFNDYYSLQTISKANELMEDKTKTVQEIQDFFKDYYFDYREKEIEAMETVNRKEGTKPYTLQ